jgi:threonine dehydratase
VSIDMVEAAASRIRGSVRRTPMIEVVQVRDAPTQNPLYLKLESLQVTGAFKARGAMNRLLTTPAEALKRGIVTASGGNHGVAVARAGFLAGVPTTVYLPPNASQAKINSLSQWNATARIIGERWDDADAAAQSQAERDGCVYFHPFKDPEVVAGQGTVALEMLEDVPDANVYVVAIGGGGLIAGVATVVHARNPRARIFGVEPVGRASMDASGHHVVRHDGANDLRHCRQTCGGDRAR